MSHRLGLCILVAMGTFFPVFAEEEGTQQNMTGEALLELVTECALRGTPEDVVACVKTPPLYDSTRDGEATKHIVDVGNDPPFGKNPPALADADVVLYWIWGETEHNDPRIVGILWFGDRPQLFHGVILPP